MTFITRLLSVAALSAAMAFAQHGPRAAGMAGTPPDPATMIQNRVDHLATLLTLTDAQKTQAITIFTTAQTANTALRTQEQTARTALETAVKANDVAGITVAANTLGTLSAQRLANDAKAQAAFYALLTADQKTKFDTLHQGGPGFGGPGPRGMGMMGGGIR